MDLGCNFTLIFDESIVFFGMTCFGSCSGGISPKIGRWADAHPDLILSFYRWTHRWPPVYFPLSTGDYRLKFRCDQFFSSVVHHKSHRCHIGGPPVTSGGLPLVASRGICLICGRFFRQKCRDNSRISAHSILVIGSKFAS